MKLYREDQKYHDVVAIGLIALLSTMLIVTAVTQGVAMWRVLVGLIVVGGAIAFVVALRLKIRIGKKNISIRIAPFPWSRLKVSKDEVTGIEFISSSDSEIASGWAVHYGGKIRLFNFGDRKGMLIHRRDGSDAIVFSRRLYEQRDEITDRLKSHGWNLE